MCVCVLHILNVEIEGDDGIEFLFWLGMDFFLILIMLFSFCGIKYVTGNMIRVGKYRELRSEGRITEKILALCIIVRLQNGTIYNLFYLVHIKYHKQKF